MECYRIQQHRSSIVTDDIHDSIILPRFQRIAIMQAGDCRRDDAFRTELGACSNTDLSQPSLVPGDFPGNIVICGIVLVFVGKSVGNVSKCITICWGGPPRFEGVEVGTSSGIWIRHCVRRPQTCS